MKRPSLLLHPGMHKTGTTAIQESLDRNRAWLREHGVAYPQLSFPGKSPRKAHHDFAEAVAGKGSADEREVRHYLAQIEQASAGARLTVLSAEPIYRLFQPGALRDESDDAFLDAHRVYLQHLRELLRDFDVSLLVYFRRPDPFAEAHFKNAVANGGTPASLDEHAKRISRFFHYRRRLEIYRDVFDHVETRCYEAEPEGGLVARFYAALDLEEPPVTRTDRVRLSHGNRQTLWLRRARGEDPLRRMHRYRVQFAAENRSDPIFAEEEPSTLWPSDAQFCAFVERHRADYEMGLFEPPEPPKRPTTIWTDKMHVAAQEAFARWLRENAKRLALRDKAGRKKYWDPDPEEKPARRSFF